MATEDGIPWDLPADRQFFSDQIADGLIVMGYGTYREIDKPLHDRTNYVVTRSHTDLRPGFTAVSDVPEFLAGHPDEVIQNTGGASLFTSTLHLADELIVTRIDGDFGCTKFFPEFENTFDMVSESDPITENGSTFTFQTWVPRRES